jgi:hypothetical protein
VGAACQDVVFLPQLEYVGFGGVPAVLIKAHRTAPHQANHADYPNS